MKTKLFTLFVALMCASSIFASDTQVDGIWYDFDSSTKTASVTYRGSSYYDYDNEYFGSVVIPEIVTYENITYSVTTIGDDAFSGCSGLISVTISNSVTTIGSSAFSGCSGLTSVTIPNSVTTIGQGAFCGCHSLTSITIPNSVTTIGNYAFESCSSLTSVTIPNSATTIGGGAFRNVNNIVYNGTAIGSPWGAKCVNGYIDGYLVYSDASKTILCGCSSAATGEITIPNSVTKIGDYAFAWCSGLTSVTIPNSVTTIGDDAFYECKGLTSVTIPNSVTTIGDGAFYGCSSLTSVIIPNSVTTIGGGAFYGCSSLTSITIPNSVTTIGGNAFFGCSGLTSVTIPNSVTTIGQGAFGYCSGLTSITIPNSVTKIGYYAFSNCRGLTSVTIPNSVTTIGDDAFYLVNNIVYNGTATGAPWGAKCVNGYMDGYLVYSDASKTILCGCSSAATGEITIPNSVITIGDYAFYACEGLTSVTIPNSVTTIRDYAFYGCYRLTSVTIPNSVTTIGNSAFSNCYLTSITCYAVTPPKCGDYAFSNILQDAKVYVPASAVEDYQKAEVWKDMQLYPIAAEVTPMDDENPVVTPTNQDVTITWPITDGTDTYTLTITKNGETVCVLTFNANGQLINIAFAAPSHNGAHQAPAATLTAQGYQFTVTGLNPGTAYDYSVTATDAGGKTLAEHKGNFSTTGGTGLNTLPYEGKERIGSKYFHNGNLIIERNGIKYTATGQKVR